MGTPYRRKAPEPGLIDRLGPWSWRRAGVRYWAMGIVEIIEMALATSDERRVKVTTLEPAEVSMAAVTGLAELVLELIGNSIALSAPEQTVRVAGSFDGGSYHISISGGSGDGFDLLNRMLEQPELTLRLASAARLAARHRLEVRFIPDGSEIMAEVTVPTYLLEGVEVEADTVKSASAKPVTDFTSDEGEPPEVDWSASPKWTWQESEAYLESVLGPLRHEADWAARHSDANGDMGSPGIERESDNVLVLRVREPGQSFPLTDDDSPSTAAAEGAVDLKAALSTFDEGRRSAAGHQG